MPTFKKNPDAEPAFYLKSGNSPLFKMKSSPAKYYEELEMFKKHMKTFSNTPKQTGGTYMKNIMSAGKQVAKAGVRGALGTTVAAASLLYDFGKRSIERKKKGLSGFNIKKTPTNRPIERHAPPKIQSNKPFTFNKK